VELYLHSKSLLWSLFNEAKGQSNLSPYGSPSVWELGAVAYFKVLSLYLPLSQGSVQLRPSAVPAPPLSPVASDLLYFHLQFPRCH
jgi:hypothetical protein